jgi:phage repressor protein C with HTH and peptisase S24 domain
LDISDAVPTEELRGPALYEALMALKPPGLSEYEWADKAGLNRGWFNDIKKSPEASPRTSNINKALAAVGRSIVNLYGGGQGEGARSEAAPAEASFNPAELPRDVPVLGTAAGAELEVETDGKPLRIEKTLVEAEPVAYVRRPPAIVRNRRIYALYITGSSMEHRYRPGDLVYVDPRRAPHVGEDVIVQLIGEPRADADPAEVISVLVKQLVRTTATHFELTQHNPPFTFRIAKAQVAEIHRIIPLSELLS